MAVVFDASILIDLFNPRLKGDRRAKLDGLIEELQKKRSKILIPTPALAEFMVKAGKARDEYYRRLATSASFQLASFDPKAAMECALLLEEAFNADYKKAIAKTKFKFDWQIVAIAASRNASLLYSDDSDIERYAKRANIAVIKTESLPLPLSARQHKLDLE